ncbi:MAG: hypothetical protein GY910_05350 [bacterium]|nr:hypothetical protein [bacterium]
MARGILLVFSNPSAPERLSEFNEWYSGTHLPEFLRLPSVVAARRFELSASQMPLPPGIHLGGRKFLAAYEVDTDDFESLSAEIMATAKDRTQSDVLERDPLPLALIFEQLGNEESPPRSPEEETE